VEDVALTRAVMAAGAIAGLGIAYDALELCLARREILDRFYHWRIVRSRYYILLDRPVWRVMFDVLCAPRTFLAAVVLHAVAALLFPVALYFSTPAGAALAAVVLVVHWLTNVRMLVGRDGADQMQNIVWAGLLAYCLPVNDTARIVALAFIPAQLILSYWTSGIAKLISPVWRDGSAVYLITRMSTYCSEQIAQICGRNRVSTAVSWLTIGFEVGSPFLLLAGPTGAVAFVATATLFHIGIAVAMGLTTFVFAFLAALPIVWALAG
jgi:hypothetical protein